MKKTARQPVQEPADGLLIRADKCMDISFRQDIPIMLIDEAIPLAGIL